MSSDKYIGVVLAMGSSLAIGSSSIAQKMGLNDAARKQNGASASDGFAYLRNPTWWTGSVLMVFGEVMNFAAYTYAPPILVTPLGGLSVIIAAILASFILKEHLGHIGRVGCALCLLGSVIIVLHAPEDQEVQTVDEIMRYAVQPGFLTYCLFVLCYTLYMIYYVSPVHGPHQPIVWISMCSFVASVSIMAIKGVGIALKLTLSGRNQFGSLSTYILALVACSSLLLQMYYYTKALDRFSTNVVNPIYYVFFSTATITASLILFRGFNTTNWTDITSLLAGLAITFVGVHVLNHARRTQDEAALPPYGGHEPMSARGNGFYRSAAAYELTDGEVLPEDADMEETPLRARRWSAEGLPAHASGVDPHTR